MYMLYISIYLSIYLSIDPSVRARVVVISVSPELRTRRRAPVCLLSAPEAMAMTPEACIGA